MNDSLVIIPTYNERENVVRMLETVMALEFPFDVLVVDDGSPDGTAKLVRCKNAPGKEDAVESIVIGAFGVDHPNDRLAHHDLLLPGWKEFAKALSGVNASEQGRIKLSLTQFELDTSVTDMLLQSFKAAPLKYLGLKNNRLGSDGLRFAVSAL